MFGFGRKRRNSSDSYNPYSEENRLKRAVEDLASKDFWVDDIKIVPDSHCINTKTPESKKNEN